ncbi:hypothetical protein OIU77_012047 [Salix suchowensis]|uniref:HHO5-like N-terminal domain-containing protein n=1 Tax=Salix suchowensis TaxID=1278906 RepID=A0ABQ9A378_9ROSI|nr:hypothetical protein OIU77_012047 [Salix suchowensis]
MDFAEKIQRCREHLEALEEERRKIQVFERELPLCLELVTQAIEAGKRELSGTTTEDNMHGESDFSEQTSSGGPLLEEFIPIKRTHSYDGNDDYQEQQSQNNSERNKTSISSCNNDHNKKSDWLRSVQLWNLFPDPPQKQDLPRKAAVTEVKRNGDWMCIPALPQREECGEDQQSGNCQGTNFSARFQNKLNGGCCDRRA